MPMDVASKCGGEENIKHLVKIRFWEPDVSVNSFWKYQSSVQRESGAPKGSLGGQKGGYRSCLERRLGSNRRLWDLLRSPKRPFWSKT